MNENNDYIRLKCDHSGFLILVDIASDLTGEGKQISGEIVKKLKSLGARLSTSRCYTISLKHEVTFESIVREIGPLVAKLGDQDAVWVISAKEGKIHSQTIMTRRK